MALFCQGDRGAKASEAGTAHNNIKRLGHCDLEKLPMLRYNNSSKRVKEDLLNLEIYYPCGRFGLIKYCKRINKTVHSFGMFVCHSKGA